MTLDDIVFFKNLPTLDLHGLDAVSAEVMICDFIRDQQKMKKTFLVIIHGIGMGVLRKVTASTLQAHPSVLAFKVSNFNAGCTIVQIKN